MRNRINIVFIAISNDNDSNRDNPHCIDDGFDDDALTFKIN